MTPPPILTRAARTYLQNEQRIALSEAPTHTFRVTRAFYQFGRTVLAARLSSWSRVDLETRRLLFNITTFGPQPCDLPYLRALRRRIDQQIITLSGTPTNTPTKKPRPKP